MVISKRSRHGKLGLKTDSQTDCHPSVVTAEFDRTECLNLNVQEHPSQQKHTQPYLHITGKNQLKPQYLLSWALTLNSVTRHLIRKFRPSTESSFLHLKAGITKSLIFFLLFGSIWNVTLLADEDSWSLN